MNNSDKEAPRITNCPSSMTIYLEPGQSSQIVTWNEPIFTDNVQVVHLNKSRVSIAQIKVINLQSKHTDENE